MIGLERTRSHGREPTRLTPSGPQTLVRSMSAMDRDAIFRPASPGQVECILQILIMKCQDGKPAEGFLARHRTLAYLLDIGESDWLGAPRLRTFAIRPLGRDCP